MAAVTAPSGMRRAVAVAVGPRRPRALRPWLLAWLAFVPVAVLRAGDLAESDTFWQIRSGQMILDQGAIPSTDSFSWTAQGQPWRMNSWGFNVLVGAIHRVGGLPVVALVGAAVVLVIGALVLVLARCVGAPPFAAGALLLLTSPLLIEWLNVRPQLVDYVGLLVLVLLLRWAAISRRALWATLWVPGLIVLWNNVHASAVLGVAVVGVAAVLLLLRRSTRGRFWWFALATVAGALALIVNPYGTDVLDQAAAVRSAAAGLTEWQPLNPLDPVHAIPVALGLIAVVVAARRREPVLLAALAVSVAASVLAIRFVPFVLLIAVPVLASTATTPRVAAYLRSRRIALRRMAVVAVAAFALVAAPNLVHIGQPDPGRFSSAVVGSIPSGCRLFNSYDLGGEVILERPDVPVFIDSRAELYGAAELQHYFLVASGRRPLATAVPDATCVIMPPSAGLVAKLKSDPSWRVLRADHVAVLLVRNS